MVLTHQMSTMVSWRTQVARLYRRALVRKMLVGSTLAVIAMGFHVCSGRRASPYILRVFETSHLKCSGWGAVRVDPHLGCSTTKTSVRASEEFWAKVQGKLQVRGAT